MTSAPKPGAELLADLRRDVDAAVAALDAKQPTLTQFLAAFFPDEKEKIRLRMFPPRGVTGDAHKHTVFREWFTRPKPQEKLKAWNKTHGMYFVVNAGGDCDAAITGGEEKGVVYPPGRFTACFAEDDERPIADQHARLDAGPLQPSIRIETGKSVHAYWLLAGDNPGDACEADWREVQHRLIAYFGGDDMIKNPSRVLRLPYFDHVSKDGARKKIRLVVFEPDLRYALADLLAAFPQAPGGSAAEQRARPAEAVGEKIPEHHRNTKLTSLAGTMRRRGMGVDAIEAALLVENAGKCDPPLDADEVRSIAESVARYDPAPEPEVGDIFGGVPGEMPEWMNDCPSEGPEPEKPQGKKDAAPGDFGTGFYASLRELHAKQTVPADDLMIGVRRRQVTIFASVTNVGKTTIMLNHALAAAGGQRWAPLMPDKPDRPLKIIFIDAESTDDELKKDTQVMLMTIGNKETALDNFIPVVDAQIGGEALDLTKPKHFQQIKRFLQYHKPDIVILDTISSLFSLYSENDNAEVIRKVIRPLKELAVAGDCAIWASHHIGKSGESDDAEEAYRGRGASAFGANVRGIITLKKEKALGDGYVRLTLGKAKGSKLEPVNLKLDFARRTFEICATAPQSQTPYQQVVGIFNGKPLKSGEIKKLLADLSGATVDRVLREGIKNGDLRRTTYGAYERPAEPQKPTSSTSSSPIGMTKLTKFGQPAEDKKDSPTGADDGKKRDDEVPEGLFEDEFPDDFGDVEGEWVG
jgi:hypothetical protein